LAFWVTRSHTNFFLRGYVKDAVHVSHLPNDVEESRQRIIIITTTTVASRKRNMGESLGRTGLSD
jgi:hypothetical protein